MSATRRQINLLHQHQDIVRVHGCGFMRESNPALVERDAAIVLVKSGPAHHPLVGRLRGIPIVSLRK